MEILTIELKKLTASDGMTLTNGETFSKEVYLGVNDKADNWHEITEVEYRRIIEEQNRALGVVENEQNAN